MIQDPIVPLSEQYLFNCDDCRWKVERHGCPWNFLYKDTDYALDCVDFRYVEDETSKFEEEDDDL